MRRILTVVTAPLVAVPLLSACTPDQAASDWDLHRGSGVYCTVMADGTSRSGSTVVASGHYRCDRPGVDSLTLTVALQARGVGGGWTTVASQQFSAAGADTTRDRPEQDRVREVSAACTAGAYRSTVTASTVSKDVTQNFQSNGPVSTRSC
jgi:hypothetical protein